MKNNQTGWKVPVTGALLFATAVSAEQDLQTYLNSTNRVTLSVRYGFNVSGKFKGIGSSFAPGAPLAGGRRTPRGDNYNYDNGYVLTDISGNAGGQTWYWGYDSASQVNSGAHTIAFDRTTALGLPGQSSSADPSSLGFELTYDHELGVKEDWHHLTYGIEAAVNFMPVAFASGGLYNATLSRTTDTYGYTPGTTPPSSQLPYQGSYQGPGFVINVPRISTATTPLGSGTFLAQQDFDANLWGFRLGPYIEYPLSKKWSLHLSGGLAVGLLQGDASWKETLTLSGGGGSTTVSGAGNDVSALWGFYVGLDAHYQMNQRWGLDAGVQFQDLGTYNHNFGGRTVEIDFSRSIFVQAGISYSF